MTSAPSTSADGPISARDLVLTPLQVTDAADMVPVLSSAELYTFTGGRPPGLAELTERYRAQVTGRSPDGREEWRNWILRRAADGQPVGYAQATISAQGKHAEIAWVVGLHYQGQGFAAAAARAVVGWLERRGVRTIEAHIHPRHAASAAVAARAGLAPTGRLADGEQVWRRDSRPRIS